MEAATATHDAAANHHPAADRAPAPDPVPAAGEGPSARRRDLDLAERHRYGDEKAFTELYQEYAGLVYNLAYRMAGSAVRAEDYTQEIFLRIHRHLSRFHGRSSLKTWIYQVSVNHCRSRLRRRRLFFLPLADEEEEGGVELVDERRSPEEHTLAADAERLVHRALGELKPIFREAVVLRDLEDLSYEEIATILGVRIGTVRSRIARGREQLRSILEPVEESPLEEETSS